MGSVSKDDARAIFKELAAERNLFIVPAAKTEKVTPAVYTAFMKYVSEPGAHSKAKEFYLKLKSAGAVVESAASVAASEYEPGDEAKVAAKIAELDAARTKLMEASAARKEVHKEQLKELKEKEKTCAKKEEEALNANSAEKSKLEAELLRLSKMAHGLGVKAPGSAKRAAAGGGGSASKKAKSLSELLERMKDSTAGRAALALLTSVEVTGVAALENNKATGAPLEADEEFLGNLTGNHIKVIKEEFLADLARYGLVKLDGEEEEE